MAKKKIVRNKAAVKEKPLPPRDEHYEEIRIKNREFREAYVEWSSAKDHAAELKKRHERIGKELTELISRGPNPQLELPFGQYDWAMRSITCLGLPDGVLDKMIAGGIETIGDLRQWWADGKYLDAVPGIGNETAALIADAYAAEHPEVYGDTTVGDNE